MIGVGAPAGTRRMARRKRMCPMPPKPEISHAGPGPRLLTALAAVLAVAACSGDLSAQATANAQPTSPAAPPVAAPQQVQPTTSAQPTGEALVRALPDF